MSLASLARHLFVVIIITVFNCCFFVALIILGGALSLARRYFALEWGVAHRCADCGVEGPLGRGRSPDLARHDAWRKAQFRGFALRQDGQCVCSGCEVRT